MSDKYCNNICRMLKIMCMKVNESNDDTNRNVYALQGSFVEDLDTDGLKETEWEEMAHNWINIEDDPDIINGGIDEAMEEMEDDHKNSKEDNNDEEILAPPAGRSHRGVRFDGDGCFEYFAGLLP